MRRSWTTFACLMLMPLLAFAGAGKTSCLRGALASTDQHTSLMVWVTFADKGAQPLLKALRPLDVITPAAINRRRNVLPEDRLVDETDLPVAHNYVEAVCATGATIRQYSKWLNCVSALATPEQISKIEKLSFVKEIDLVACFRQDTLEREIPQVEKNICPQSQNIVSDPPLNYGPSLGQVSQINVPGVHQSGNSAQGVIVGVFDNGFRLLSHVAFDSLRSRIIGQYDFVDHKVSVIPNNTSAGFGSHGVNTLSTIGGFSPGNLIGPAYGASFILARTENDSSETPFEEDNWVAAIEWAESLGVQVTSTSLGYLVYDAPYKSWTWADMNGKTTKITKAATIAARKGVVVVNSAGNNGNKAPHNTLNAPADADSILTVGAVDIAGVRATFSSIGPTTDNPPRIKPDVMAMGVGVAVASSTDPNGFASSGGTSFSCPLAAGVAALLVKAKPSATPMQIINALRNTADQSSAPDNEYGWGIVNAAAAIANLTGTPLPPAQPPAEFTLDQNFPNPFNPTTVIHYTVPIAARVTLKVYDVLGSEVRTLVDADRSAATTPYEVVWDGTNAHGRRVASGMYLYRMITSGAAGVTNMTKKMVVLR